MADLHPLLHQPPLSLDHVAFANLLATTENLLMVQDLDGVCMALVNDPLNRVIDPEYVQATQAFDGHFYVLTNGEHIGQRGVNGLVERACGGRDRAVAEQLYLPGLAAGGIQWQDRDGRVSHPGVSDRELAFLAQVPAIARQTLQHFFADRVGWLDPDTIATTLNATILDNPASPTVNLNAFGDLFADQVDRYRALQGAAAILCDDLLRDAVAQGLDDSFFIHFAPNLGRDERGLEVMRPARPGDRGTTDFQFMLRGAVKEAGIVALLNHYYFQRTGSYPLGAEFNARSAPHSLDALLDLVKTHFDPAQMPLLVGIGDTVNSSVELPNGDHAELLVRRGGSDRNFLQLIQAIGRALDRPTIITYIDSSGGEVQNRRPLEIATDPDGTERVLAGPGDPQDHNDPLTLDLVFPGGHPQYIHCFREAARSRTTAHFHT